MAIQLPTIERNTDPGTPSVGRVDIKPVDASQAQATQSQAIVQSGNTIAKFVDKAATEAADTKATEQANQMQKFYRDKLYGKDGVVHKKGDPTQLYKNLDEQLKKQFDTTMKSSEEFDYRTQNAIREKVTKAYETVGSARITTEGKQVADYTSSVANSAVELARDEAVDATANLDIYDKNALIPLNRVLAEIRNLRYKEGVKNNTITETEDPTGAIDDITKQVKKTVTFEPSTEARIKKDISDTLLLSIQNLASAGDVEGAEFVMKEYKDQIEGPKRSRVEKELVRASKDQKSKEAVSGIMNMEPDKAAAEIDKIQDFDVRESTSKRYDSEMRRRENLTKRASKTNYQAAANVIMERSASGNGFQDSVTMMDDDKIKQVWSRITDPKQKLALQHMVDKPKDSDQNTKNDAFTALFNGDFEGMAPEDFALTIAGLNSSDAKMFTNEYKKARTKTAADPSGGKDLKWMGSQLTKELQTIGYVKKDTYGKYTNKDQIKLNNANSELIDAIDRFPPNASFKEKNDYIKKFAAQRIKEKGELPEPPTAKFNGGKTSRDVTPTEKVNAVQAVTNVPGAVASAPVMDMRAQQTAFKAKFGRWPDVRGSNELQEFIKKGGK